MEVNEHEAAEALADDGKFRYWMVSAVTRLESNMKVIFGNGQPGRLQNVETRLGRVEKFMWSIVGALVLLSAGIGWIIAIVKVTR